MIARGLNLSKPGIRLSADYYGSTGLYRYFWGTRSNLAYPPQHHRRATSKTRNWEDNIVPNLFWRRTKVAVKTEWFVGAMGLHSTKFTWDLLWNRLQLRCRTVFLHAKAYSFLFVHHSLDWHQRFSSAASNLNLRFQLPSFNTFFWWMVSHVHHSDAFFAACLSVIFGCLVK